MPRKTDQTQLLRLQNKLLENLAPLRENAVHPPYVGWVTATREALTMSRAQLAHRMGVTRARISQIESAEVDRAIKLSTLQRAAEAMNCQFVYAFVPNDSYADSIRLQADSIAQRNVDEVVHTMALEGQTPSLQDRRHLKDAEVASLIGKGKVWDQ